MDEKWSFYAAFEDRFRGSFDEIKGRAEAYLPYLQRQTGEVTLLPALDLGSGRGEWLSLLNDHKVRGIGVDQNPVAVERARELGLEIHNCDLFESLIAAKDGCYRAVSAFHVIEHLPWEMQLKLFLQCYRVLAPGGLLIIEWPNTENPIVATQSFWLDPTHVRPLPVQLAGFMAEYVGFGSIETIDFRPPVYASSANRQNESKSGSIFRPSPSGRNRAELPPELQVLAKSMSAGFDIALICTR